MDGSAILSEVRAAYARCTSYRDTGDVVAVFIHGPPQPRRRTTSQPFSTWFVRPNRFRFEFAERAIGPPEEWSRYVVWERDGVARNWWTIRGESEPQDLPRLIGGATGVSGGAAHRVPPMLMPERFKRGDEPTVTNRGIEQVDGVECHTIELAWKRSGFEFSELWWVGASDYLIRKEFNVREMGGESGKKLAELTNERLRKMHAEGQIEEDKLRAMLRPLKKAESFRVESTTTYAPEINVEIADDAFDFRPPA